MSATEAMTTTATLYQAIAAAVKQAADAGLDQASIQVVLEKAAEIVGEADES